MSFYVIFSNSKTMITKVGVIEGYQRGVKSISHEEMMKARLYPTAH